jgi:limonene-1,2-epoxide hydrolase
MNPFDEARARATAEAKASIDLIESFFAALEAMDFSGASRVFTDDGLYRDEPTHAADATGPAAIEAKLTNAIEGLDAFVMGVDTVVGDADRVMSRRIEEWHFPTGEVAKLPVTAVHEISDGKIMRWHEFWNMPTFTEQMPASWMEVIMKRAQGGS